MPYLELNAGLGKHGWGCQLSCLMHPEELRLKVALYLHTIEKMLFFKMNIPLVKEKKIALFFFKDSFKCRSSNSLLSPPKLCPDRKAGYDLQDKSKQCKEMNKWSNPQLVDEKQFCECWYPNFLWYRFLLLWLILSRI